MTDETIFLLVGIVFLVVTLLVVLVLWIFLVMMKKLVNKSDFPQMAQRWPALATPEGITFSRQNIALNAIWYKNCATIIITKDGLYISFGFPVSSSIREEVLIPWKYITYLNKSQAYWTDVFEYQIAMDNPVILTVSDRVAQSFPGYLQPVE